MDAYLKYEGKEKIFALKKSTQPFLHFHHDMFGVFREA